jgi:hypothetical protein
MNTQPSQSFGRTEQSSLLSQTSIVQDDALNVQHQRGTTALHPKAYKLRVSGSNRIVKCVARWGNAGFTGCVTKVLHAVFITAQPLTSIIECS